MGVFSVPIAAKNWQNQFRPEQRRGEEVRCEALVETGAAELALPTELIERLRLQHTGEVQVDTADGGEHTYRVFGIVELLVQGRSCQVRAIQFPHDATPLLGAVPLKEMDWHVSPQEKKLCPLSEIPGETAAATLLGNCRRREG